MHTTRPCDCELLSHAERHVTLAQDAVVIHSLADGALTVPAGSGDIGIVLIVKPGHETLCLSVWKQKWGIQPSPSPLPAPSHFLGEKKTQNQHPALNFFPGLSCRGRAQQVASACHVTLVFAVSHAMTSQPDWRTMEIKLLYVKMEKLSLSRRQAGEHQLQMGREGKREKKKACLSG